MAGLARRCNVSPGEGEEKVLPELLRAEAGSRKRHVSGEQGVFSVGEGENKPAQGIAGRPLGTGQSGLRLAFFLGSEGLMKAFRAWHDQKALEEGVWP